MQTINNPRGSTSSYLLLFAIKRLIRKYTYISPKKGDTFFVGMNNFAILMLVVLQYNYNGRSSDEKKYERYGQAKAKLRCSWRL
jgi:hypothetical protein